MITNNYYFSTNIATKVVERIFDLRNEKGKLTLAAASGKSMFADDNVVVFTNVDFVTNNAVAKWQGQICIISDEIVFLCNINGYVDGFWIHQKLDLIELLLRRKAVLGSFYAIPEISPFFQNQDFMKNIMYYLVSTYSGKQSSITDTVYECYHNDKTTLYKEI